MSWKFVFRAISVSTVLLLGTATGALVEILPAQAAVWTDQADYAPGSTVTVSGDNSDGAGYVAGETVHVDFDGPSGKAGSCDATADDAGAWSCQFTLGSGVPSIGSWTYTATGQTSGVSQSGTFTDASCPGSNAIGNFLASNDGLAATFTDGGSGNATYTFTSNDESPVDGVPGLIEYCVYPGTLPDSQAASYDTWTAGQTGSPGQFHFGRPNGNPTNVPFDGTTQTMGTATWTSGTVPTSQTILLHINDFDECQALYPGSTELDGITLSSTCFVTPGTTPPPPPEAQPPTVSKTATPSLDRTYTWTITKDACAHNITPCKQTVKQVGGSVTFDYTIKVSHDAGTDGNWQVNGTITVTDPNADDITGVDLSDAVDNGGTCSISGGDTNQTVPGNGTLQRSYSCTYSSAPSPSAGTNTVTMTWPEQTLSPSGDHLTGGSDTGDATFDFASTTPNPVDDCVTVTDTFAGSLGTVCVGGSNPTTFTYSRTVSVPNGCTSYPNTASFTTDDTGATGSASQTVKVCGPVKTGALTMGFWKNSNGNSLIKNYCVPSSNPSLATYLSTLPGGIGGPFADAAGKSCSALVTYVNGIINGASATNMNKMLEAQMLATALDVYFSTPSLGYTTTKVGSAKPPSSFLPNGGIGTFVMDLTAVCPMIDNLNTGTATCLNNTPSTNGFAAGAVPWASQAVNGILSFAATTGVSPWATGAFTGTAPNDSWYGTDRTKQEILKNIFDQLNNQMAFGP